jgi:hypothetical protein
MIAVRPDLSARTSLSKSALVGFDMCPTKAWHDIRHRQPLIPAENITFGSALDAGIEVVMTYLRMGATVEVERAYGAAADIVTRDDVDLRFDDLTLAIDMFVPQVAAKMRLDTGAPEYDFAYARFQEHLRVEDLAGMGEAEGHPDVILHDGRIFDVKSAKRAKPEDATVELGFYAVLLEAAEGKPVPSVGYWTWVRTSRPYWQVVQFDVTDQLRRWTVEKAASYTRAKRADEVLNREAGEPTNYTFTAGPMNRSLCGTCQYAPVCAIAWKGENDDAA